jgi:HEAT repeat protein
MAASRSRTRRVALVLVAGGLLAGGLWLGRTREAAMPAPSAPVADGKSQAAGAASPDAVAASATGLRWRVGEVRLYQAELSSLSALSLESAYPQAKGSEQQVSTRLTGVLRLDVFEEQAGIALVKVSLQPQSFSFNVGGNAVPGVLEQLGPLSRLPLVARVQRDGRVLSVRAAREHEQRPLLLGPLKSLLAALQPVQPPRAGVSSWEGEEDDTTGLSVTAYARDGATLRKNKRAYRALATPAGLQPVGQGLDVVLNASGARLSLEASGWPESVASDETVDILQTSPGPDGQARRQRVATITTQVSLRLTSSFPSGALAPTPPDWLALPERRLAHAVEPPAPPGEQRPPHELMAELLATDSIQNEADRLRAQSELMQPLSEAMRRMPLAARMAGEALRSPKGLSEDRASTLIGSLMTAGTPEAQLELSRVVREPKVHEGIRRQALGQLGLVEQPTAESVALARETLGSEDLDVRATGSLALGSMTRSLRQSGQPLASDNTALLLRLLREARTEVDKVLALDALGNAGSPEALAAVVAALEAPEAPVRNSAVRALRQLPPGPADDAINRTLIRDPESMVREGAVFALGFRELTRHLPAIRSALTADPQARVRLALVRMLGDRMMTVAGARELLTQAASADADPDVRNAAREELTGPLVNQDGQWRPARP